MIIRAIDAGLDAWIARRVTPPRSDGQHVSVILTDMLKSLNVKRYESWGKNSGDNVRHPMHEAGYAWEDVLAKALSNRPVKSQGIPVQYGELSLDDIYGTPDNLFVIEDNIGYRVVDEEAKFTWMSCKPLLRDPGARPTTPEDWIAEGLTEDAKFTYWLLQAKTYAAMLHLNRLVPVWTGPGHTTLVLNQAPSDVETRTPLTRLRALFINGAYRDELAIPGAFEIEWTPEELTIWWTNVKHHAEHMRMRESLTPETPTF